MMKYQVKLPLRVNLIKISKLFLEKNFAVFGKVRNFAVEM